MPGIHVCHYQDNNNNRTRKQIAHKQKSMNTATKILLCCEIVSQARQSHLRANGGQSVIGRECADVSEQDVVSLHTPRYCGIRTSIRTPCPGRECTVASPPALRARARMPIRPRPRPSVGAALNPRPSSWIDSRISPPLEVSFICTCCAAAWRAILVSASCEMRKRCVSLSSGRRPE